jgi:hypothetical protein
MTSPKKPKNPSTVAGCEFEVTLTSFITVGKKTPVSWGDGMRSKA